MSNEKPPQIVDPETVANLLKIKELEEKQIALKKEKKEIEHQIFLLDMQRAWTILAIFTRVLIWAYFIYYFALWLNPPSSGN